MVIGEMTQDVELAVIGGGPGGYTAALRAAELGIKTVLVESMPKPGGVCLHMGCIPSKALLHAAEVIEQARHAATFGLTFASPSIDLDALRSWKVGVTDKLAQGITGMCKSASVEIIHGRAVFEDSRNIRVEGDNESPSCRVKFKHAILATGSRPVTIPALAVDSDRLMDSTAALALPDIPQKLLVVGGGYIGLEIGSVYSALGSEVTVVEMTDGLLPGVDRDLVRPLATALSQKFKSIMLSTRITSLKAGKKGLTASFSGDGAPAEETFDRVLVAVGRRPNSDGLGLERTKVTVDKQGFVAVDSECRTADSRILAIGDVSGQPMLAHRAMRQGMVAAEVLAGHKSSFDNRAVPAVVFTEPEIAWCGLTETQAKALGREFASAKFPWSANGRAMTLAETAGTTKVLFDPETTQVLGVGIVGPRAGDLIAEAVLAIEMGAVLEDLAVSIHAHPTLSETIMEASAAAIARLERQKSRQADKARA